MSLTQIYIYSKINFHTRTHLLQLSSDVVKTEVRSQCRSPMMPGGSSDSASRWRSSAAAATARPAAAPPTANTVTTATTTTTAAPCWLLPAAAPRWRLLADLEKERNMDSVRSSWPHTRCFKKQSFSEKKKCFIYVILRTQNTHKNIDKNS